MMLRSDVRYTRFEVLFDKSASNDAYILNMKP